MKDTLELIGDLLYIVFCVVAFPVLVATECFIGLLITLRYVRVARKKLARMRIRYPEPVYQFLLRNHVFVYRK